MAERMGKTEFVGAIADKTGVAKKDVKAVLDAMNEVVMGELGKNGPGEAVIPGLLKLNVIIKPAVPERDGVNPFTKQPTVFKAKPERRLVKARVLKGLKDAIGGVPAKKAESGMSESAG
ncbi:MAG: HU family DNA-binding protein [Chloroflexi bacterium]|nr:HU family DNA-binding protein [Chloroflexota bacterium]